MDFFEHVVALGRAETVNQEDLAHDPASQLEGIVGSLCFLPESGLAGIVGSGKSSCLGGAGR